MTPPRSPNSRAPLVAGVDEVGRGALFGPVVAAAAILSDEQASALQAMGVGDSKTLSGDRRLRLARQIRVVVTDCRIGWASAREIDRLNILQASLLAMKRAILKLDPQPQFCLIDGNQRVPNLEIPQDSIVGGDRLEIAIAAASIVAKVWRDTLIVRLDRKYPGYDLAANKGYGTRKHREALRTCGPSTQHRLSFAPCAQPGLPLDGGAIGR